jgi:phage antirepressor YoqD-like protein
MEAIQENEYSYFEEVFPQKLFFSTSAVAKRLGMGARALNRLLYTANVILPSLDHWTLNPRYRGNEYEIYRRHIYYNNSGLERIRTRMYWSEKGMDFIIDHIENFNK